MINMYSAKNHSEGPDKTVIGGELEIDGTVTIKPGVVITGGRVAATQVASVATDVAGVVTDLNALITKLKAAGLMANS